MNIFFQQKETYNNVLLEAKDLVKKYGDRKVVNKVNLSVKKGEVVGLLGPNGAGKTTTFYMLMGLVRPTGGKVLFKGADISHASMSGRARLGMGYLSQEPSIFRKLTVEENIMAVLETLPLSKKKREERLEELLNDLNISHLRESKAYTLSGGERRRLEITRVLVTNPSLILLDEPFSGVDPIAVADVQNIVKALRDKGLGILITDHNVRETLSITDITYLVYEGKILKSGTSEFLSNDKEARQFYLGERFSI